MSFGVNISCSYQVNKIEQSINIGVSWVLFLSGFASSTDLTTKFSIAHLEKEGNIYFCLRKKNKVSKEVSLLGEGVGIADSKIALDFPCGPDLGAKMRKYSWFMDKIEWFWKSIELRFLGSQNSKHLITFSIWPSIIWSRRRNSQWKLTNFTE